MTAHRAGGTRRRRHVTRGLVANRAVRFALQAEMIPDGRRPRTIVGPQELAHAAKEFEELVEVPYANGGTETVLVHDRRTDDRMLVSRHAHRLTLSGSNEKTVEIAFALEQAEVVAKQTDIE